VPTAVDGRPESLRARRLLYRSARDDDVALLRTMAPGWGAIAVSGGRLGLRAAHEGAPAARARRIETIKEER